MQDGDVCISASTCELNSMSEPTFALRGFRGGQICRSAVTYESRRIIEFASDSIPGPAQRSGSGRALDAGRNRREGVASGRARQAIMWTDCSTAPLRWDLRA